MSKCAPCPIRVIWLAKALDSQIRPEVQPLWAGGNRSVKAQIDVRGLHTEPETEME